MRSHYCGDIRAEHCDTSITLCGWVDRRRDHGGGALAVPQAGRADPLPLCRGQPPGDQRAGAPGARAGAHVVRGPGDDAMVGRLVAQRVVRRLDGRVR